MLDLRDPKISSPGSLLTRTPLVNGCTSSHRVFGRFIFIASGTSPRPAYVESMLLSSFEENIGGVLVNSSASARPWMIQWRKKAVRKNEEGVDSGEAKMTATVLLETKVRSIGR